jgi:hypothetical protein
LVSFRGFLKDDILGCVDKNLRLSYRVIIYLEGFWFLFEDCLKDDIFLACVET